jgi:tRNA G10  N-methylase Trm11
MVFEMTDHIYIFGREPEISLSELESLLGAEAITPIGKIAAMVQPKKQINFNHLGGSKKAGTVLLAIPSTDWESIEKSLIKWLPSYIEQNYSRQAKIQIGLSAYGLNVNAKRVSKTGIILKKAVRAVNYSVRITPNKEPSLNSAQVIRNKLTSENGLELLLIKSANKTLLAKTGSVQKIDDYAKRDQNRPFRDQRVGMLPPKLAQTIINLAKGEEKLKSGSKLLDPFCGTGVLLQEALLMGYEVEGSDIDPRMVEYSAGNLDWLKKQFNLNKAKSNLEIGDATRHQWSKNFSLVASETYLGAPFHSAPSMNDIKQAEQKVTEILEKFLVNLSQQTPQNLRACLAVPAWHTKNGFYRLKTLEKLEQLGYTRIRFKHVDSFNLIYHRPGQFVARELIVIKKSE